MQLYNVISLFILLGIVAMNAYVVYVSRQTEKNTNSMKDALVESTRKASRAEGVEAGRAEKR